MAEAKVKVVGKMIKPKANKIGSLSAISHQQGSIYSTEECSPTLDVGGEEIIHR